jgi:hypothetical protein
MFSNSNISGSGSSYAMPASIASTQAEAIRFANMRDPAGQLVRTTLVSGLALSLAGTQNYNDFASSYPQPG